MRFVGVGRALLSAAFAAATVWGCSSDKGAAASNIDAPGTPSAPSLDRSASNAGSGSAAPDSAPPTPAPATPVAKTKAGPGLIGTWVGSVASTAAPSVNDQNVDQTMEAARRAADGSTLELKADRHFVMTATQVFDGTWKRTGSKLLLTIEHIGGTPIAKVKEALLTQQPSDPGQQELAKQMLDQLGRPLQFDVAAGDKKLTASPNKASDASGGLTFRKL